MGSFLLPIFLYGVDMFSFDGGVRFGNVDLAYLKHLHNACSEFFLQAN